MQNVDSVPTAAAVAVAVHAAAAAASEVAEGEGEGAEVVSFAIVAETDLLATARMEH